MILMPNSFDPTNGNKSLHEISNDNGVRVSKFPHPESNFEEKIVPPSQHSYVLLVDA
jgi:hypothetical protein